MSTRRSVRYSYRSDRFDYVWQRDFPVALQTSTGPKRSEFSLEFELSTEELQEFRKAVGSHLSSHLKVKLSLGSEDALFEVLMKGKAKKNLNQQRAKVADFIANRIVVQYIPSIRTSELARDVIEDILERELQELEKDNDYLAIIKRLADAQKPILADLGASLTQTIRNFVPDVQSVTLETEERLRSAVRRSCRVLVDDGACTDLDMKGDGVKSLTAISLMRHASHAVLGGKSLILAIEEPESHLHPMAVHRLREVLLEIAQHHQVMITTHSPMLVERQITARNIIVRKGKASEAKGLAEIRECLGVQMADNLLGAYLVLLVEGSKDQIVLSAWLPELSPIVGDAISRGLMALDDLGGGTNLSYKASLYRQQVCNVHAFLDNDDTGREMVDKAQSRGVITASQYQLATCRGMDNSEFEDLIDLSSYAEAVSSEFG